MTKPATTIPWRWIGWGAGGLLLAAPLVAMQFTNDVVWTPLDFAFAGALIGGVGLGLELAVRRTGDAAYRAAAALALAATFFLVWINGAVGIIGDDNDATQLYGLVPAVALLGAALAGFRPAGLAWAMTAAALAQAGVPVAAWLVWPAQRPAVLAPEVIGLTVVFTGLWLVSAALFRRAARR